ncbi:HAD family hydrolase [Paenibacillus sp. J5C_2022]|uniref:HAD family hydrolase n=1 Tax=Paenibacillus sp. J5C2022 TaxID=2977129 RepID=UPI0021D0F164|nr:HAD family hydrolase [Paenibacillus sp. J5C2022]MCU6712853.1 HAD family hydrolase [Paenibacillus sp. J5C2022]
MTIHAARGTPRAAAFDMDGTLLRSDGTMSARTERALRRYSDSGGIIIIATGRPPRLVLPLFPQLAVADYFIFNNGAVVVNSEGDWRVEQPIPNDTAHRLHQHVLNRHADGICIWEVADRWHANRPLSEEEKACFLGPSDQLEPIILSEQCIRELQPSKMLLPRAYDVEDLSEKFQNELNIYRLSSAPCVEMAPRAASKASGVEGIALRLGLSGGEIGAFGDDYNDLAMFRYCGHSVAMHNAVPELASIASDTTASNDEDGVATKLEQWLHEREG